MIIRRQMQKYSMTNPSSDNVLWIQKCSGTKPVKFIGYKNHSAFRGKFKTSSIEVFYPS